MRLTLCCFEQPSYSIGACFMGMITGYVWNGLVYSPQLMIALLQQGAHYHIQRCVCDLSQCVY